MEMEIEIEIDIDIDIDIDVDIDIDIDIDISSTVSARWSGGPRASILASSLSSGATQVWAGQVTTRAVHMMPAPSLSAAWLRVSVSVPGWSWSCTV